MKALTVRQPWASAIVYARKDIENRSWATPHRGPLAIHAGKAHTRATETQARILHDATGVKLTPLPTGAVLGVVALADLHHSTDCYAGGGYCSPWADADSFHWQLTEVQPLSQPVPVAGALQLWTPPAPVLAAIAARLNTPL